MNYYEEGYNKGYQDAIDGEAPLPIGMLYGLVSAILDDKHSKGL